ncbi:hypothetical protein ACQKMK_02340 [Viridibacillus arvi]|uniref:hypothetical protein n=1 Tax=Viridibacillus arvi TaxID=263475 RepID=UPI003D00E9C8
MVNNKLKLVKSATAFVIGAAVLTGSFAAAGSDTAFAKSSTSVKVSNGKLVYKSTGKVVKGYKTYNKALYKDGKKLTGLYKKTYYKAGKKATGTYKSVYYKAGKAFTGVTNKTYYKAGKKATGTYKNVYYKSGKAYTGVVNKTYYKAGKKATGLYKGVYYKTGKAATGIYKDQLYISGNLSKGLELYKEQLYKDGSLNKGLVVFKDQLYKDAVLNKGFAELDGKFYFDAALANDTYIVEGVERAFENGVEVGAKVKAVEAINATQVKITFNKTVEKETVINSADKKVKNVTFKSLDNKDITSADATGELAKDGKTLTITAKATEVFEGRYDVTIDNVKDVNGKDVAKYEVKNFDFGKDITAPAVLGTEKVNATKVKVNFSEPLSNKGSWAFKDANGNDVTATTDLSSDGQSVEVTITDANLKAGSEVTATILGAKDKANNVINPNPSTVKFVKGDKDGVAPVVSSVTSKGLNKFEIKFSEEVQGLALSNIFVDGTALVAVSGVNGAVLTPDTEDKTKYVVELKGTALVTAGLHKVEVKESATPSKVTDLSGEELTVFTQLVDFKADLTAPKFVNSQVIVDETTKEEKLVLTFDKEVAEPADFTTTVATELNKDLVTTNGTLTGGQLTVNAKNKKQLVVILNTVKFTPAGGNVQDLAKDATYTVKFAKDAILDTNSTPNKSEAFEITFKRGEDGTAVNTDKPAITTATATNSNTITVIFDKAVDGVTATNVANYSIPGLTIEKATLNPVSSGTQSVTLTLKKGTNTLNGDRVLTVANVKAKTGVVMETVSKTVADMKENVAPTVTKAQFTETAEGKVTTLKLTFSEKVIVAEDSFEAFVGDDTTVIKLENTEVSTGSEVTEVVLTVETGKEFDTAAIAKGITVKLASDKVISDVNSNALDFTSIKASH